jgi:Putative zinc-finger
MTCPITVRLGVYALGAAGGAERLLVDTHLGTCAACRAELARLAPLPGLLAHVPVDLVETDLPPASRSVDAPAGGRIPRSGTGPGRKVRAAPGRWRSAAAVAAAAALSAGGFWLAQPAASHPVANPPPAAMTVSGANPATHVRLTATLTGTSWGTSIRLLASGLPLNQPCRLIVRSRGGRTEMAGAWDAWSTGPVSIPASAGWRLADITSLQVATTSRSLITLTTARPDARGRATQAP